MNPSCINHRDRSSAGKCPKCASSFCDECLAFTVNGIPWCEVCCNNLADDVKPRWVLFGLVLGGGFTLVTLIWIAKVVFIRVPIPYFYFVMMLGYGSSMYAAWSVLSNTTGHPPEIKRRR